MYLQTPEEWEDLLEEKRRKKGGSHKRSSSVGNSGANDNLKEVRLKQTWGLFTLTQAKAKRILVYLLIIHSLIFLVVQ